MPLLFKANFPCNIELKFCIGLLNSDFMYLLFCSFNYYLLSALKALIFGKKDRMDMIFPFLELAVKFLYKKQINNYKLS